MGEGARVKVWSVIVSASLLAVVMGCRQPAPTNAQQFDLVCRLDVHSFETEAVVRTERVRFSLDLEAGRWCEGDRCDRQETQPITEVTEDEIHMEEAVPSGSFDIININRMTGEFAGSDWNEFRAGRCEAEAYSGPQRQF